MSKTAFSHEPKDYNCPFCAFLGGHEDEYAVQNDIVYQNEYTTAFIAPKWWNKNPGHVLVIPNKHYENLYTISDEALAETYKTAKKIAVAIRNTYDCDGTSTRQHNEPAGNQAIWHLHVHVFPRYEHDKLYHNHDKKQFVDAAARAVYAEKLRAYFTKRAV